MPTQHYSRAQVSAALSILKATAEAVRDAGELGVPSGTLYATMMDLMSASQYESMIGTLLNSGLIRRNASHLLTWTGPAA